MKTKPKLLAAILALALFSTLNAHLSSAFAQGSLTPPGPPAASMLTLSQVEPRMPVDATHTPGDSSAEFRIFNPGSYYLTTNVVATGGGLSGILIQANNVTLDLNGFAVLAASNGNYGVYIQSGFGTNVSVYNGVISGWVDAGIYCGGYGNTLERLTVSDNGIGVQITAPGSVVRNSIVSGNTGMGIECLANNLTFEQLMVSSNNPGFFFSGVASGVVRDCTANANVAAGVECDYSTNMTLQDLTTSQNSGYGMNLYGFQNSTVSDCKINGNASNTGVYLVGSSCFILGNSCSGNGNSIFVQGANNQIDGNHVIGSNPTSVGIWINNATGITNNIVVRNFVTGYGANDYSFGPGQITGPIITSAVSGIITNSNPWANFGF